MPPVAKVIAMQGSFCSAQVILSVGGMGDSVWSAAFVDFRSISGLKGKQEILSSEFAKDLLHCDTAAANGGSGLRMGFCALG